MTLGSFPGRPVFLMSHSPDCPGVALTGLLTVLLAKSKERRKQFLMSSYERFNCVGF